MAKFWPYDAEIHGRFPSPELRDAFVQDVQALAQKYGLTPKKVPATIYLGTVTRPAEAPEQLPPPPASAPGAPPKPGAPHLKLVAAPVDEGPESG